jgi:hypothetical protein
MHTGHVTIHSCMWRYTLARMTYALLDGSLIRYEKTAGWKMRNSDAPRAAEGLPVLASQLRTLDETMRLVGTMKLCSSDGPCNTFVLAYLSAARILAASAAVCAEGASVRAQCRGNRAP